MACCGSLVYDQRMRVIASLIALVLIPSPVLAIELDGSGFSRPRAVPILGLPAGSGGTPISTEEPFVTRDGRFLLFNSGHREGNKDLHFAEQRHGRWVYRGEIGPDINTPNQVQGNPTMDTSGRLYFIDTSVSHMARGGRFHPDSGRLENLHELVFLPDRDMRLFKQRFSGNMGVEVSADGNTLYFSRATWKLKLLIPGDILASDILLCERQGNGFAFDEALARRIMRHVNSDQLEYAAAISRDGLELFFTRMDPESLRRGKPTSRIMRATRTSRQAPFNRPVEVRSIGHQDFVEGPTLSADEKTLFYHKRVGGKFRLFRVGR